MSPRESGKVAKSIGAVDDRVGRRHFRVAQYKVAVWGGDFLAYFLLYSLIYSFDISYYLFWYLYIPLYNRLHQKHFRVSKHKVASEDILRETYSSPRIFVCMQKMIDLKNIHRPKIHRLYIFISLCNQLSDVILFFVDVTQGRTILSRKPFHSIDPNEQRIMSSTAMQTTLSWIVTRSIV